MKLLTARAAGVLADTINDANSTRKVYLLAAGLAVLGLALIAITVWFWRSTRHDPELLGPLEVLGDRKFRRLEGSEQREIIEKSRPSDVKPLAWGVERGAAADDPALTASGFDASLVVADDGVVGAPGAASPERAIDPHSDLDSILAAAGAVVPGRPAAVEVAVSNGKSVKDPGADKGPVADPVAASVAASGVVGAAEPGDAAVASPLVAELAGEPAMSTPGGADSDSKRPAGQPPGPAPDSPSTSPSASSPVSAPGSEPVVAPLLIVPVDHELRPSLGRSDPIVGRDPAPVSTGHVVSDDDADRLVDDDHDDDHDELAGVDEHDAEEVEADPDATASIDPLLRMFNRNDT